MAQPRPIHPGQILRESFLEPRRIGGNRLAIALHVPPSTASSTKRATSLPKWHFGSPGLLAIPRSFG